MTNEGQRPVRTCAGSRAPGQAAAGGSLEGRSDGPTGTHCQAKREMYQSSSVQLPSIMLRSENCPTVSAACRLVWVFAQRTFQNDVMSAIDDMIIFNPRFCRVFVFPQKKKSEFGHLFEAAAINLRFEVLFWGYLRGCGRLMGIQGKMRRWRGKNNPLKCTFLFANHTKKTHQMILAVKRAWHRTVKVCSPVQSPAGSLLSPGGRNQRVIFQAWLS